MGITIEVRQEEDEQQSSVGLRRSGEGERSSGLAE